MPDPSLNDLLSVAIDVAYAAGKRTLAYFNTRIAVELKADQTPVTDLPHAAVCSTSPMTALTRSDASQTIPPKARLTRGWSDCYGHVLVATGRAEIMLDPRINPWDCAPLLPVLREAGGHYTTWRGDPTIHGPDGVSTNAALHGQVLDILRNEKLKPGWTAK